MYDYDNVSSRFSGFRRPSSFQDLPVECLAVIFGCLNEQEICSAALVCRRWHEASKTPNLWQHADFRLVNKHKYPSAPKRSPHFDLTQKYKDYTAHLLAKHANIRHLSFDLDLNSDYETLAELISSGRCHKLTSVDMKWADSWDYRRWNKLEDQLLFFHSLLVLMGSYCTKLQAVRTQFNWTTESLNYLLAFKNLEELELSSVPRVHPVQRWHIETLLAGCVALKKFKIDARILPDLVYKYSFKSDSLELLDISMSVNLFIVEMVLPRLHTFTAKHFTCYQKYTDICLFEVLDRGCPALQYINDVSAENPGLQNFGMSREQEWDLRICYCTNHCGSGRNIQDVQP
ncbi:uncharacterized protein LOC102800810 [Saccoglossus kowalevskii]|uniref:Uncharacterized protein LOC102800810 n=1 Tax=Saccoglossus kowalevskii TaxID=10224 RepID=A0ABM0M3J8_SACKO|nr:PREDICTED: uncharacterized protein LOC102800810 [Saccoglossus kowalevskii]